MPPEGVPRAQLGYLKLGSRMPSPGDSTSPVCPGSLLQSAVEGLSGLAEAGMELLGAHLQGKARSAFFWAHLLQLRLGFCC